MTDALQQLQLRVVVQGQPLEATSRLREHLLHGAARRVGVIKRAVQNIYALFPPETERPLNPDILADVQINLHAFVMNLYGLYDNWAWAYVLKHGLETVIVDKRHIGLFREATQSKLPTVLREYLSSQTTTEWHEHYAKSFRDALAHRIPPYIPPAQFTPEEGNRYNKLENEKVECIKAHRWQRLEEIYREQAALGLPCLYFLHAYNEDSAPRFLHLHPQILSDAAAVVEFGNLFLEHWHGDA
ncbi:MAG TPA: hypothetical protein PKB14_02990 [Rubrivivax sp.]|nr:hypothetical protein [Rubrivivax sp.]